MAARPLLTTDDALSMDDALAFIVKINAGRKAIGLTPIRRISREHYAQMRPGSPSDCLSASLLFNADGQGYVLARHARVAPERIPPLAEALGVEVLLPISSEIFTVTNVFDRNMEYHNTGRDPVLAALQAADLIEE